MKLFQSFAWPVIIFKYHHHHYSTISMWPFNTEYILFLKLVIWFKNKKIKHDKTWRKVLFGTFLKQSNYFGNSQAAGMETRNINKTSVFKKPTTRINMLQMEPQTMFSGVLQPLSLETVVNLVTALKQQYFDILHHPTHKQFFLHGICLILVSFSLYLHANRLFAKKNSKWPEVMDKNIAISKDCYCRQ